MKIIVNSTNCNKIPIGQTSQTFKKVFVSIIRTQLLSIDHLIVVKIVYLWQMKICLINCENWLIINLLDNNFIENLDIF